jgi:hypothetical protein
MPRILDQHRLAELLSKPINGGLNIGQRGASVRGFRQS